MTITHTIITQISVLVFIGLLPCLAAENDPQEIEVAIQIGLEKVPLSVHHRFRDVAAVLPKPGLLPDEDAHDQAHDSHTYCYRFGPLRQEALLEFFDSDFGLHTARLSRVMSSDRPQCAVLSSEPLIIIGTSRLTISSKPLSSLPGFVRETQGNVVSLEREWTYSNPSRPHMGSTSFCRAVSIEAVAYNNALRSIQVQNWEEPC
jgi:hypothetical protein